LRKEIKAIQEDHLVEIKQLRPRYKEEFEERFARRFKALMDTLREEKMNLWN
jgi:hypothetical protein